MVCERATEEDIAELLEICDRGDEALAKGSYPMALSAEFHTRVARASHNAAIVMLAESFHGPTLRSLQHVKDDHPEMGIRGNREHRQFVAAIKKRDVEKAIAVMRTHIGRTARHVSKDNDSRNSITRAGAVSAVCSATGMSQYCAAGRHSWR